MPVGSPYLAIIFEGAIYLSSMRVSVLESKDSLGPITGVGQGHDRGVPDRRIIFMMEVIGEMKKMKVKRP